MQIKLDKYLEKKQICNQARQMIREKTNMQIRQNKKKKRRNKMQIKPQILSSIDSRPTRIHVVVKVIRGEGMAVVVMEAVARCAIRPVFLHAQPVFVGFTGYPVAWHWVEVIRMARAMVMVMTEKSKRWYPIYGMIYKSINEYYLNTIENSPKHHFLLS